MDTRPLIFRMDPRQTRTTWALARCPSSPGMCPPSSGCATPPSPGEVFARGHRVERVIGAAQVLGSAGCTDDNEYDAPMANEARPSRLRLAEVVAALSLGIERS
jgi:hypothetical protein